MTHSTTLRNNYAAIEDHVLNWRRWGLSRSGVFPTPNVCITQKVCEMLSNKRNGQDVNVLEAERFEEIVQSMRRPEKTAFCFYALGFASIDGKVKIARNIGVVARHLRISQRQAYRVINKAVLYVATRLGVHNLQQD